MKNDSEIGGNSHQKIEIGQARELTNIQTEYDSIKEVKPTKQDMSNFNINKDFLKNMGIQTLLFVKKNRFVKIDFLSVIKYSLMLLLLEFMIYIILQVVFSQVSSLSKLIKNSSIFFPIFFSILFVISVLLMMIIQLKKKMVLLGVFKFFEFLSFSVILSKSAIKVTYQFTWQTSILGSFRCQLCQF